MVSGGDYLFDGGQARDFSAVRKNLLEHD